MTAPNYPTRFRWWAAIRKHGPKSATKRGVLVVLSTYASSDGSNCFPSQRAVAEAACVSEKHAQRILREAQRDGWLEGWLVNIAGTRRHRKRYRLTLPDSKAKEQHRHTAGLIGRQGNGRFRSRALSPKPNNPVNRTVTAPSHSGGIGSNDLPSLRSTATVDLATGDSPPSSTAFLKRRVRELAKEHDAPTIAALLHKHEIDEATIRAWIAERAA